MHPDRRLQYTSGRQASGNVCKDINEPLQKRSLVQTEETSRKCVVYDVDTGIHPRVHKYLDQMFLLHISKNKIKM